jgi:hypothetical protein
VDITVCAAGDDWPARHHPGLQPRYGFDLRLRRFQLSRDRLKQIKRGRVGKGISFGGVAEVGNERHPVIGNVERHKR